MCGCRAGAVSAALTRIAGKSAASVAMLPATASTIVNTAEKLPREVPEFRGGGQQQVEHLDSGHLVQHGREQPRCQRAQPVPLA